MISALKTDRGLALADLLNGAYEYIETINFKPHARIYLLDFLATTECVRFDLLCLRPRANCGAVLDTDYRRGVTRKSSSRHFSVHSSMPLSYRPRMHEGVGAVSVHCCLVFCYIRLFHGVTIASGWNIYIMSELTHSSLTMIHCTSPRSTGTSSSLA